MAKRIINSIGVVLMVCITIPAFAQTYDLSGIWYDYTPRTGNKGNVSEIIQEHGKLVFINEFDMRSEGYFLDNTTVVAKDWEGGLKAIITDNGRRLEWANGSVWQRSRR